MAGFDDPGVFFSDNFGPTGVQGDDDQINRQQIKNKFREFIRQFHEGNFTYRYRFVQKKAEENNILIIIFHFFVLKKCLVYNK